MQKLALQMVKKEHEEGEQRLKEAVLRTEQRCEQEKIAAVKEARQEERQQAAQAAAAVARWVFV